MPRRYAYRRYAHRDRDLRWFTGVCCGLPGGCCLLLLLLCILAAVISVVQMLAHLL